MNRPFRDRQPPLGAGLVVLSFAMLLVSLDQYIVVVALPDIARDLGYSPQLLQSVVSSYVIASGGFLLFGGRACDLLGKRRVLLAGLGLYCAASLAGGLATEIIHQLAARAVQGLGGALVFPSTLTILNVLFREGAQRNRALSIWSGSGAAGLVLGVLMGGALTAMFGWRAIFLINVPFAAAAIIGAMVLIEPDGPVDRSRAFDLAGAVTVTAAISLLVTALIQAPHLGWGSGATWVLLMAGAAFAILFVIVERRSTDPLLPLHLLGNRWLRLGLLTATLFSATFGALLYFLSILFQEILGYDAWQTGLAFLLPTVLVVAASSLAGRLVTKFGLERLMLGALTVGAAGAFRVALAIDAGLSYPGFIPGLVGVSLGDGAMFTAMFIAASTNVDDKDQGVASGIVSTGSSVGGAVGLALLVLISTAVEARSEAGLTGEAAGLAWAIYGIAGGIAFTLLLVVMVSRHARTAYASP